MSPPVHEVRNAIRVRTGRLEREVDASFTNEELRAICEVLDGGVDGAGRPSTARMRRLLRAAVGIAESPEAADDSTFRKADPRAIADPVESSSPVARSGYLPQLFGLSRPRDDPSARRREGEQHGPATLTTPSRRFLPVRPRYQSPDP